MAYTFPAGTAGIAQLFADLVRCETRLYNALNDSLRAAHGIVTSQFEMLRYLRDHPGSRVADLAGEFAIGIGATSKGLDRLEGLGWVRRSPNPVDRRSSLLDLTADGLRLADAAEVTFTERTSELIAEVLTAGQISAAAKALARLRAQLEHDQIGTPTG